ncbi:cache domain-containing protein [Rheinheimera salexigens]|uniref:Cache domain-containing protein n=1 Tax=Rheinheimera salexigens TaxID=1628148 RepID=A0A1E7Q3C3_9GAMM|nr:cache domain-containing protein [Rheinheimera salexigens]OEY68639.1 hypothetical protein BI198_02910 [Rheinheimera salexigens]
MKNPVYTEYKRARIIGIILIIALSIFGAFAHYLRAVDDSVLQTKLRLNSASSQIDTKFSALLAYATALQKTAQLKLLLPVPPAEISLPLLSFTDAETVNVALTDIEHPLSAELNMLQQLQPYFDLVTEVQPFISNIYYISEQGYAYNGLVRWPDYIAEQILSWQSGIDQGTTYNRETTFHAQFMQDQSVLQVPLYEDDKKLGRFLFALDLKQLLKPVYALYANTDLMLLDQAGNLIPHSTSRNLPQIDQHLIHVQRLANTPWSLAVLEPKTSLFTSGLNMFVWHLVSYLVLLSILFFLMHYRFKRRVVSPVNRLFIHIERLGKSDVQGVRHIPLGWNDIFDKVYRLTQQDKN